MRTNVHLFQELQIQRRSNHIRLTRREDDFTAAVATFESFEYVRGIVGLHVIVAFDVASLVS